jgi:RecA/RadA recombinase
MAKEFSFNDLDEQLTKISPKGSVISVNSYSKIDEWISTGNFLLNAQLSGSLFGGIPNSRSICLAGESGTGKTFLALNICREAQLMGYNIIYCDSEAAVDQDVIQNFGVDPDSFRYQPVSTPLEVRQFVAHLCDQLKKAKDAGKVLPKVMLVLDSLGNLATTKERADAISGSDKRDMTKQQELRSLFRVITADLAELKIPFVFTNHTYATIGSYVPGQTISGGGGAIYNASVILQLSKAGLKEDGTNKTGIIVTSKPAKNRFARPLPIKFHISFYKGMNPYVGLEQFLSWKNCGVQRGKLLTEKEFQKYYKEDNPKHQEVLETEISRTNEDGTVDKFYLEAKETARTIAVAHLFDVIKPQELFSSKVFTRDMLKSLDENFIQSMFKLPNVSTLGDIENDEISEMISDESED